jgi:hypothetical protein
MYDGRQQVLGSSLLDDPRTFAMAGRDVCHAGRLEVGVDRL